MTRALWSKENERCFVESQATRQCEVELESAGAPARQGLWCTETGSGSLGGRRWWLRPGREADEVEALLDRADWFRIEAVAIAATRLHTGDELWCSDAELLLEGRVDFASVGREMQTGEVPIETLAALQRRERGGFAFSVAERPDWPAVFQECARRVRSLDLAPLVGSRAASVASLEFVGTDLLPAHSTAAHDPGSLAERLLQLASVRLLVEVCSPDGRHVLCLQPDLVWLWSCLEAAPGPLCHRSRWTLEPDVAAPEAAPAVSRWRCAMQREEVTTQRAWVCAWGQVLLTPFAATADAMTWSAEVLFGDMERSLTTAACAFYFNYEQARSDQATSAR